MLRGRVSALAWAEPPVAKSRQKTVYEIPDFGTPVPGQIADVRWAHALGTNNMHKGAIAEALRVWLDDNPSFWALVGTFIDNNGNKTATSGWSINSLHGRQILHALRNGHVYARSMFDLGGVTVSESLQAALDGENGAQEAVISLPKLTKDPFGWTEAELNLATATARDWLYPTEELVAA